MIKHITLAICVSLLSIYTLTAQVNDDFDDGDFLTNPTWVGNTDRFVVTDGELQSNGAAATEAIYLSTSNGRIDDAEWRANIRIESNPSGSNFLRYYLVADQANLSEPLNGYFIGIGETGSSDGIDLFRQTGTELTKIIDGPAGTVAESPNVRLKVTRDAIGNWEVLADLTGGENFVSQGTVLDDSIFTTAHLGIFVNHTSTRNQDFFFDNIFVGDPIQDTLPPELVELDVVSNTQVDLFFSEQLQGSAAQDISSYSLNNGLGNPANVIFGPPDSTKVSLFWASPFENNVRYELTISNLADLEGNVLVEPIVSSFLFFIPDVAQEGDVIISEIMADPNPTVGLPDAEYIEIWNISEKIFDLDGWILEIGTNQFTLPTLPLAADQYVIISSPADTALFSSLGQVIGTDGSFTLPNDGGFIALRSPAPDSLLIDTVAYDRTWFVDPERAAGGFSLEIIDSENISCPPIANWQGSIDPIRGTPGGQNSTVNLPDDTTPPALQSIAILAPDQIEVCFNEAMDSETLIDPTNFVLEGIGAATTADPQAPDFECVILNLPTTLDTGQIFTFVINNVADCKGNIISEAIRDTIVQGRIPVLGEIILTEMMIDPTPIVGLPDAEYIEIFNTTDDALDISGWSLADASGVAEFGEFTILPFEYVVVVEDAQADPFTELGRVLRVDDLFSLGNERDSLVLRNAEGELVEVIVYTDEWYQDPERDEGGYSLERIDTAQTDCAPIENWRASLSLFGGTPGSENSVIELAADSIGPVLVEVDLISTTEAILIFDESMDENLLGQASSYVVEGIGAVSAAIPISPNLRSVQLTLPTPLDSGETAFLIINDLADCKGNVIEAEIRAALILGNQPQANELIFNEILSDPNPVQGLPEAEYIEIFNRGDRLFDLQGVTLSNGRSFIPLPNITMDTNTFLLIVDLEVLDLFEDVPNVIGLDGLFSLGNSEDSLFLRNSSSTLIDAIFYNESWYQDPARDGGGFSLERIDPDEENCAPIENWSASLASIGGTPGTPNSVLDLPPDIDPPQITEVDIVSQSELLIVFDESMDEALLGQASNYVLEGQGAVLSAEAVQPDLRSVRLVLPVPLDTGSIFTLIINGLADCEGNVIEEEIREEVIFGLVPQSFEIIFNELFPDPIPSEGLPEVEFIELFNRGTNTVDINDVRLINGSRSAALPTFIMNPGDFVVLVDESEAAAFSDLQNVLAVPNLPDLGNSEDSISLENPVGEVLDVLAYNDTWYQDVSRQDGGFTLERIDPDEQVCAPIENWRASMDFLGGTPGRKNSVAFLAADSIPPFITGVQVLSSNLVVLNFNESMDGSLLDQVDRYVLEGFGAVLGAAPIFPDLRSVRLTLPVSLDTGEVFLLAVNGLADCKGNFIEGQLATEIVLGFPIEAFDLIFNEIFPDPSPPVGLPDAEFVELFNRRERIFDLNGVSIINGSRVNTLPTFLLEPQTTVIIVDEEDANLFEGIPNVIAVPNFIGLGDSDEILLENAEGELVDFLFYEDTWYQDINRDDGGYTLERIDSDFIDCNLIGNWRASLNPSGGTPGRINSVDGDFIDSVIPQIDKIGIVDVNTLRITFSEQMDPASLAVLSHYAIDQGIGEPFAINVSTPVLRTVDVLFNNDLEEEKIYNLTLSNLADCSGNVLNEVTPVGIPQAAEVGDILLNEILFNAADGGADYVEMVNVSNKLIDLKSLIIRRIDPEDGSIADSAFVSEEEHILVPGELLCLTEDVFFQRQRYVPSTSANFLRLEELPSYPSREGEVQIASDGITLDRFFYQDDFHFPTLINLRGVSLERISLEVIGSSPNNWHSAAATSNFGTPGDPNSQGVEISSAEDEVSLANQVFTPNGDGEGDNLEINFDFDIVGANARVRIYDERGRLIRLLQDNILLGSEPGTFFWDGRNDDNQKAPVGIYIILFEITDQETGERTVFKEPAVLADIF